MPRHLLFEAVSFACSEAGKVGKFVSTTPVIVHFLMLVHIIVSFVPSLASLLPSFYRDRLSWQIKNSTITHSATVVSAYILMF